MIAAAFEVFVGGHAIGWHSHWPYRKDGTMMHLLTTGNKPTLVKVKNGARYSVSLTVDKSELKFTKEPAQ